MNVLDSSSCEAVAADNLRVILHEATAQSRRHAHRAASFQTLIVDARIGGPATRTTDHSRSNKERHPTHLARWPSSWSQQASPSVSLQSDTVQFLMGSSRNVSINLERNDQHEGEHFRQTNLVSGCCSVSSFVSCFTSFLTTELIDKVCLRQKRGLIRNYISGQQEGARADSRFWIGYVSCDPYGRTERTRDLTSVPLDLTSLIAPRGARTIPHGSSDSRKSGAMIAAGATPPPRHGWLTEGSNYSITIRYTRTVSTNPGTTFRCQSELNRLQLGSTGRHLWSKTDRHPQSHHAFGYRESESGNLRQPHTLLGQSLRYCIGIYRTH